MKAIHPNDPSLHADLDPVPGNPWPRAIHGAEAPVGGRP